MLAKRPAANLAPPKMSWRRHLKLYHWLYIFLIPGMLYLLVFRYIPMAGIVIAFKDFNNVLGIFNSPWVGFKHFAYLFQSKAFFEVLGNSLLISLYRMVAGFPAPIILALLLNELRSQGFKRSMQTVLYLPHFISWVVVYGVMLNFLSPTTGILNHLLEAFGLQPVSFLTKPEYFRSLVVISDLWKTVGWGTVVYMAAIAGIDPTYYEAAIIDGASRTQRILHVTLPLIGNTIIVMLILRTGTLLSNGFEQIFLMQNSLTLSVSEVFETYTYKVGIREGRFSFATAVGLFQAAVGFILIYLNNYFARKAGDGGLW